MYLLESEMNDSELSNRLRAVEQELQNPSSELQVDGLLVSKPSEYNLCCFMVSISHGDNRSFVSCCMLYHVLGWTAKFDW